MEDTPRFTLDRSNTHLKCHCTCIELPTPPTPKPICCKIEVKAEIKKGEYSLRMTCMRRNQNFFVAIFSGDQSSGSQPVCHQPVPATEVFSGSEHAAVPGSSGQKLVCKVRSREMFNHATDSRSSTVR